MPWERTSASRLLNLLTRRDLGALSRAEAEAERGEKIEQSDQRERAVSEGPYVLCQSINLPPCQHTGFWTTRCVQNLVAIQTCHRATVVTLALEAWKLRHGALPKSLGELVGPCLDRLPVDPVTGEPFRYFREGVKAPLRDAIRGAGAPQPRMAGVAQDSPRLARALVSRRSRDAISYSQRP